MQQVTNNSVSGSVAEPGVKQAPPNQASERISAAEQRKLEFNASILKAQASASEKFSAQSQPLSLFYKTTLEAINERLAPELGENALDTKHNAELDVSPEATADRILRLSTGLYSRYSEVNPDMDEEERINRFVDVIGGGIEQGFKEAKEILDALGALSIGNIEQDINKTSELTFQGLEDFRKNMLEGLKTEQES